MKAFISEQRLYSGPIVFGSYKATALLAEAEARAILAETQYGQVVTTTDLRNAVTPRLRSVRRAAAESLAAFVALEIS